MKNILKLIYWLSLCLLGFWIVSAIAMAALQLEFSNGIMKDSFAEFRFGGVPVAILLTLAGTLKREEPFAVNMARVLMTILITCVTFFIMTLSLFGAGMCSWSTGEVLYKNKADGTIEIVNRGYGCGATDSGLPVYKTFEVKQITAFLVRITEIDTAKIDKRAWLKIQ